MATLGLWTLRKSASCTAAQTSFARTSLQLQRRLLRSQLRQLGYAGVHHPSERHVSLRSKATAVEARAHRTSPLPQRSQPPTSTPSSRPRLASTHTSPGPAPTTSGSISYLPPSTGLLSALPRSWVPYAELVRLDKPTGTYYLFLPCLFSTLLAAPLATPIAPPFTVLGTSTLFLLGALIMRGAGCTINDLWDRNLDPHVERTRLRPIARGAVSVQQAIPFLGVQLLAGLGVLVSLPPQCLWYGIPSLLLVATYPLAKRVTHYPQFVLGLTFSWGAIMGFPALSVDLLAPENTAALISAACLYASCVAWTVVYDMIYAYQDIRDDALAGIKSIALAQQPQAKAFLSGVAALQVALLTSAGVAVGAGPAFFTLSCGGAAATLSYMIRTVDLGSVEDCWGWFRRGAWLTGGAIASGLLGEYVLKYLAEKEREYHI